MALMTAQTATYNAPYKARLILGVGGDPIDAPFGLEATGVRCVGHISSPCEFYPLSWLTCTSAQAETFIVPYQSSKSDGYKCAMSSGSSFGSVLQQ